jgi:hypothetical protein
MPLNEYAESATTVPSCYSVVAKNAVRDLPWAVNGDKTYVATLQALPKTFAWNEAETTLSSVAVLGYSTALRRFESALVFIREYDERLSKSIEASFEALPAPSRARFLVAPETVYRISRLRNEPVKSIALLCHFLNAESASQGSPTLGRGYWTATGDSYFTCQAGKPAQDETVWVSNCNFVAPRLANAVPVDFFSPNVKSAKETTVQDEFLEFTPDEIRVVWNRLVDVFDRIELVSGPAARLINEFIRVIIPLKVPNGAGSTSERSFPGRVLLRGVEASDPVRTASALVHESIHQFLYLLEYEGTFVLREPEDKVRSLWSGRLLPLHSYFHACFVWYGLAKFWALAHKSNADVFGEENIRRELDRCLSGFRGQNPISALGTNAVMVRSDALRTAGLLQERLGAELESYNENRVDTRQLAV